jgi:hypothetical protein
MQVNALITVASEAGELREQVKRLTAATEQTAQERAASESAAMQRLQAELSTAIADTAASRDRLQTVEAELLRAQQQVRRTAKKGYTCYHGR